MDTLIDAGVIRPDDGMIYRVAYLRGHKTLVVGDLVLMREVGVDNVFVRITDMTVHKIYDENGYVIVVPEPRK